MTKIQIKKFNNCILGILTIAIAIFIIVDSTYGYLAMLTLISFGLAINGIKELFYFFTMAR